MEQGVGSTMTKMRKLEEQVGAWPHVSVHPHRFGGREFRFGNAELGHVHVGGTVDIPFPRGVRDALLAEGLAEEHRWVPNSGWTTFHVRDEGDLQHALWLMRLSYLRYAQSVLEVSFIPDVKRRDRKSTRLNSSHANISYAVFCLKKKKRY